MKRLISGGLLCLILSSCMSNKEKVVIAFAGDTMLGRSVNEMLLAVPLEKRYTYPWGNLLPQLKKADLRMVNLETTLTKSAHVVPKVFNFKADPEMVNVLQEASIDLVSIANNHILDFNQEGLVETLATLDAARIEHVGAGTTIHAARKPVVITKNGIKIGVFGYTDNEPGWLATEEKPGINYIKVGDFATVKKDLEQLRPLVDILVVSLHWGPNMRERPSAEHIKFAHELIDHGVDIIHGHSAHIFQGIEIYKGKVILYDTGDLVDDYMVDPVLRNDRAFIFFVTVEKSGPKKIELVPTLISQMQVNIAAGADRAWSLDCIKLLSAEFGTTVQNNGVIDIITAIAAPLRFHG